MTNFQYKNDNISCLFSYANFFLIMSNNIVSRHTTVDKLKISKCQKLTLYNLNGVKTVI